MDHAVTQLPWNPGRTVHTLDLRTQLTDRLPSDLAPYLPGTITLFWDTDIPRVEIQAFTEEVTRKALTEIRKWRSRSEGFVRLGLFSAGEVERFLTARRHAQPWALYFSLHGGLDLAPSASERTSPPHVQVITCFSLSNHGVAWHKLPDGEVESWLVTSRRQGAAWDWDSDIGHELAHATFCHVPLFSRELQAEAAAHRLWEVGSSDDLTAGHLVRMAYHFSEIPVSTLIEESRPTETNLPVEERQDLHALLRLADELMPGAGFARALAACERVGGIIDTRHGDAAFEVAAPIMRIMPALTTLARSTAAPTLEWYRSLKEQLPS